MTNQPTWEKVLKCFTAPKNKVMFSSDFNALEDRASAIKTNDPNKVIIFEKDLDSHSFRMTYYFPDMLPKVDITDRDALLKLKKEFGDIRDESKPITFGKTYGGGDQFLIKKGYSPERIKMINDGWNNMFAHSLIYESQVRKIAEYQGYVELLFGLKLRTPVLHSSTSSESDKAKEFRSIFNATTQCFGMLTSRAAEEFLVRVRNAPINIQEGVQIINLIHDDIIGICDDTPEVISWVNKNLLECMAWQEDEYITHDTVHLTSTLKIGRDWGSMVDVNKGASLEEISEVLKGE